MLVSINQRTCEPNDESNNPVFYFGRTSVTHLPVLAYSLIYMTTIFCLFTMMIPTYIPVQKIEAKNGIVYAYRRLGPTEGIPLVLHMHVSWA